MVDYTIKKVYFGLKVWSGTNLVSHLERILNESFLNDFIDVDIEDDWFIQNYKFLNISIGNPAITQECLIAYIEKIITDYIFLEKCYKLKMEDKI